MKLVFMLGLCALTAFGEDGRLTGPVPGFVFDRTSKSIRPILGIPGSSYLGAAVINTFDNASVSPLGISALATQGGKLYFIRNLDGDKPDSTRLDQAIPSVHRIAWSQDGLSAAVYSGDSHKAQILRNLDPRDSAKSPTVGEAIDLSTLNGRVSALAFDGKRLLIGAKAQGAGGGVYLAGGQSSPKLLAQAANPVALSLDAAKGDLYIADRDNNQIWMVRDYAGDATPMLFVDDRAGVSAPVGIRVSANGKRLLIANAGNRGIDSLELSTRAPLGHVDLDFAPSRMEALGAGSLSLLNFGGPDGPLYVLDDAQDPAVYFVPAGGAQ